MSAKPEAKEIPLLTAFRMTSKERYIAYDEGMARIVMGKVTTLINKKGVEFRVYDNFPNLTIVALAAPKITDKSPYYNIQLEREDRAGHTELSVIEIGGFRIEPEIDFFLVRANLPLMEALNLLSPRFTKAARKLSSAVRSLTERK